MLHRLLACLALITGLTLTGAPAYARSGDVVPAQVEQGAAVAIASATVVLSRTQVPGKAERSGDKGRDLPTPALVHVPTVELGVDRAHE